MKKQLEIIWERLKKPSVIMSIASQVITILIMFNIKVDATLVNGVIASACSILVLLGIMSNPSTKSKGFSDDIHFCEKCGKQNNFIHVDGKLYCPDCGKEFIEKTPE